MRNTLLISVLLLAIFACGVAFAGQAVSLKGEGSDGDNAIGIANPASVYCGKMGGKSNIVTNEDGSQYGMCVFADGSKCEEWAYYKGECTPISTPSQVTTTTVTSTSEISTTNIEPAKPVLTLYTNPAEIQSVSTTVVQCAVDDSINQETNSLLIMLKEAEMKNDTASMTQIKLKISSLQQESNKKLTQCRTVEQTQTTTQGIEKPVIAPKPTTVAVSGTTASSASSMICEVPAELQKEYDAAWAQYKTAIANNDDQAAIAAKPAIAKAEQQINEVKAKCRPTATEVTTLPTTLITTSQPAEAGGVGKTAMTAEGTCTVPVELTQEFEGQWKNYNTAIANNDTAKAVEIKAKIAEIEQKISSTKGQCVKTIVSDKAESKDVTDYYKQKMTQTLSSGTGDIDTQIASLQQLRTEIDNVIANLIRKKSEFNASDATGLVNKITVKKNEITAGTVTVVNATSSIVTSVNAKEVKVKPTMTGASINEGGFTVAVSEATIDENKLKISGNAINVAPSEVGAKVRMSVKSMSLDTENSKPIYNANGTEERKLFAILPVTIEKTAKVDAGSGAVVSESNPWWNFLTTDSQ